MTRLTTFNLTFLVLASLVIGCDDSRSTPSTAGGGQATGGGAAALKPSAARDAAVAWARAIAAGDTEAARAASTAASPAGLEAAEAYFAVGASEAKLNAALKEKFGGEQNGGMINALATQLAQADVHGDDGDTATLTHDNLNTPVVLRKQPDGTWKVDVTELAAGAPIFKHMSTGTADIEAEVRDGKHASADAAWAAAAAKTATLAGAPGGGGGPGGKGTPSGGSSADGGGADGAAK